MRTDQVMATKRRFAPGLIIVGALILFVYSPTFTAGFLEWDDDYNLLKNPHYVIGPWWRLWFESWYGLYVPVTSTLWKALLVIGSGEPWPFRLFNLLVHGLNTWLVARLLRVWRPDLTAFAVWAGAALFALHPLQVGAVAWISGGRDLLAALFSLLAVLMFTRGAWVSAALLFAFAVFSKPSAAVVPLAVALGVYWRADGAGRVRLWLRLLPWIAASGLAVMVTRASQASAIEWQVPLYLRPWIMLDTYGFHLAKTIFPYPLAADYGRMPLWVLENWSDSAWLAGVAALALAAAFVWRAHEAGRAGWIWFVLLLPVSGVVDFGFQYMSTVADHYNYLALVPVAALAALALKRAAGSRLALAAVVALTLACCGYGYARARVWSSAHDFYQDMLAANPNSFAGALALGTFECLRGGDRDEGFRWLKRAERLRPDDAYAAADLAACLFALGRGSEVLELERQVSRRLVERLEHNDIAAADLLASYGAARFYAGDFALALTYFCQSVWRNPMRPSFRTNVETAATVLRGLGQPAECGPRRPVREFLTGSR